MKDFMAIAIILIFVPNSIEGRKCLVSKGDIGIVLDGTCMTGDGFDSIINVLKNLVKDFQVSEKGKRFSYLTYKDFPYLRNVFVDDRYENTNAFLQLLDATQCIPGRSTARLDFALLSAANMFSHGGGQRDVKRTLILVTHSRQNACLNCTYGVTDRAMEWFKQKNVQIMVISIGKHESISVLRTIAGDEKNVYMYNDVDSLVTEQTTISAAVCKSIEVPGCPPEVMMGLSPDHAPTSCKELLNIRPAAVSGVYWINPSGNQALQVYCNMTMSGGGWTLVYSYTFTNYKNFRNGKNAVTPQPTWPTIGDVVRSSSPPLSETHYAAMDYKLWKNIGHEFIIKSNINHWIQCKEETGSLVDWKQGTIKCHVIKNVASKCHDLVPDTLEFLTAGDGRNALGVNLKRSQSSSRLKEYYYLEGSTRTNNWPTHDPCGTNSLNQVTDVPDPHGNIYIR